MTFSKKKTKKTKTKQLLDEMPVLEFRGGEKEKKKKTNRKWKMCP